MSSTIEESRVRLRTVVIICTSIIGGLGSLGTAGVWRAASTLTEISRDIRDLKSNSITRSEASDLALRAAMENPGLRVPDPRNPSQILVVVKPGEHPT